MSRILVSLGERSYEIVIGRGTLADIGEAVSSLGFGSKIMIVTSHTVWPLHGKIAHDSLARNGFEVSTHLLNDDEEAKSLQTVMVIIDDLLEKEFDRNSAVVAVGGGVIGDVAGFAAATYMRGIGYVQVPTTLLAQIDSSIGGKTGVNHPKAKNLVGAFHQPRLVWTDVSTLSTLPNRELRSGLGEVIKYGVIADPTLCKRITDGRGSFSDVPSDLLVEIVCRCCSIKASIIEKDERDRGIRSILNYGHTIGHALETLTGYTYYTHGEAVGIGMLAAAKMSCEIGAATHDTAELHESMMRAVGLPNRIHSPISPSDILEQVNRDKKRTAGRVRWVLPRRIGEVFLTDQVPRDVVLRTLASMIEPGR